MVEIYFNTSKSILTTNSNTIDHIPPYSQVVTFFRFTHNLIIKSYWGVLPTVLYINQIILQLIPFVFDNFSWIDISLKILRHRHVRFGSAEVLPQIIFRRWDSGRRATPANSSSAQGRHKMTWRIADTVKEEFSINCINNLRRIDVENLKKKFVYSIS